MPKGSLRSGLCWGDSHGFCKRILRVSKPHPWTVRLRQLFSPSGPLKALGPNGLHPILFQSHWDTMGGAVCELVRGIFQDPRQIRGVNETSLVLIPKVEAPTNLKQYHPISLCNVAYKIVTNIVATRMRHFMGTLISPNQCSFVPGRHSSDNIIIAQEIFHSMRLKKGETGWMAIKVDLEKAYDRLRWEFIMETLTEIGFKESFVGLLQ